MKKLRNDWLLFYLFCVEILGILCFLYGFFPVKLSSGEMSTLSDLPANIRKKSIDPKAFYGKHFDKMVLMIIDALRYDFVFSDQSKSYMPYTSSLIEKNELCLLKARVEAPTVTMPRIKALMTGNVPSYIDVIMNFGKSEMRDDNLLFQAANLGLNLVFYGDETWLKLFPNTFKRSEATTSFFVSDYIEVCYMALPEKFTIYNAISTLYQHSYAVSHDTVMHFTGLSGSKTVPYWNKHTFTLKWNKKLSSHCLLLPQVDFNVTRNVEKELNSSNWDVMILHYLGLDHIGHLEGPHSKLIKPKLQEMDNVIFRIQEHLRNMAKVGKEGILIVCGDHGMHDKGGHGGTSLEEVIVPVLLFNYGCDSSLRYQEVNQIDLTPLISVLMGLPIPAESLGRLHYNFFTLFDNLVSLYALHYNTMRMKNVFYRYNDGLDQELSATLAKAEEHFEKCIANSSKFEYILGSKYYYLAQNYMFEKILKNATNFDFYLMAIGWTLFLQVLLVLSISSPIYDSLRLSFFIMVSALMIFGHFVVCKTTNLYTILCSGSSSSNLMVLVITCVISANIIFFKYTNICLKIPGSLFDKFLLGGLVFHLLSYASSSYIEEEHEFWYFMFTTLCLYCTLANSWKSVFVAVIHRLFRSLNQTGNKWISLPDVGDWLNEEQNKLHLLILYSSGLAAIGYYCHNHIVWKPKSRILFRFEKVLFYTQMLSVFCYRAAIAPFFIMGVSYPSSRGLIEAKFFWACMFLRIITRLLSFKNTSKKKYLQELFDTLLSTMLPLVSFIFKPHNVILIAGLLYFSEVFLRICGSSLYRSAIVHQWLGMLFFFYQGNSNALSTIDVSSGFVGLEEYNIFFSGTLISLNTFAAPLISNILLLRRVYSKRFYTEDSVVYYIFACWSCVHVVVFLTITFLFRYHLFVWTVFSPKLLYLSCEVVMYAVILFIVCAAKSFYSLSTIF